MPPKGIFSSAKPPTQKSTASRPVMVTSSAVCKTPSVPAVLVQAPVLLRKSMRSAGAPAPPSTRSEAAARLSASVMASVMLEWVP
ncbi:hypothetical protein D3C81_830220 [compost metagenome]|nr:hypothetical protein BSF40_60360 [Pseudomonas sp. ACN5]